MFLHHGLNAMITRLRRSKEFVDDVSIRFLASEFVQTVLADLAEISVHGLAVTLVAVVPVVC